MSIKKKILLYTLPFFLLFGIVSMFMSINALDKQGSQSLEAIHTIMIADKEEKLQDLVRNTYEIIAAQYRAAHDSEQVAEAYRRELESLVNLAYSAIEGINARTDISDTEKKELAFQTVSAMRYGGDNYLWINDTQPAMIMHPIKPALNGEDLTGFKDPNGKPLFVEMVKVVEKTGQGYVDYMWPKPGKEDPVPKLSFVRLFEPWGWIIGTGVYLETAEERFQDEAKKQISNLRFGPDGDDYFFILDSQATIIMHPIKPELDGKDMNDFTDPAGNRLFYEMTKIAGEKGEGFVEYMWAKPGEAEPVPKLSFVKLFPEWGWIVGTGIYTDDIEKAMAIQNEGIHSLIERQRMSILAVSIGLIVIVGGVLTVVASRISAPIKKASLMLKDIAQGEGDLTSRLIVNTRDELADMANWFNVFVEKLQKMIRDINRDSNEILISADSLATISGGMSSGASETSDKANTVAAAAEEMSANMSTMAGATDETAANVNMVSAAVEEMNSTISEIAETAEKARAITEQAVRQCSSASGRVDELGQAAREISQVLTTIAEISSQVDLLALNATIEAARAGDAGKGFAVVANEIKDLAKQTSIATSQIRERIEGIQTTTNATVQEIENITSVVGQNSEVVNTIATAVEEQSVTAGEISKSINHILQGIQEINGNVSQSFDVSAEIAREIAEVNEQSRHMSSNAGTVSDNAGNLNRLAESFAKLVGTFKV